MATEPDLAEQKKALRDLVRAKRRELSVEYLSQAAQNIADNFIAHHPNLSPKTLAGYWPGRFEASPLVLMQLLAQKFQFKLCLPVVVAHEQPLIFRQWQPGDELIKGNSAMTPKPDAPILIPDFLLVPLIAFDGGGGRLGQGGGFYDRTLAQLRDANPQLRAIGIALDVQKIDHVPRDRFDLLLDAVVTETHYLDCALLLQ